MSDPIELDDIVALMMDSPNPPIPKTLQVTLAELAKAEKALAETAQKSQAHLEMSKRLHDELEELNNEIRTLEILNDACSVDMKNTLIEAREVMESFESEYGELKYGR